MNRRRALRALILGGGLLFALVLLAHAALVRWSEARWAEAAARYEREVGSLDLRSWELPRVSVGENAATWISKGAAAVVFKDSGGFREIAAKPRAQWDAGEIVAVRAAVDLNREALQILARARTAEASTFGIPLRDGVEARIPNLLEIMNATKLLYTRGALALSEGRREDALADLELLATIARSLQPEPVMIVILIGAAVEKLELRLVHDFAEDPATTPAEIARLQASLLRNDLLADYARSYAADGTAVCTALREGTTDALGQEPTLLRVLRPAIGPALAAACLDTYREIGAILDQPHPVLRASVADVQARLPWPWLTRATGVMVIPNLVDGASRMTTNLALRRLATVALSARGCVGAYPPRLDELAGAVSPDPLTGGAPRWQVASDGRAVLDLPGAEEMVAEVYPPGVASSIPWSWRLPAPR